MKHFQVGGLSLLALGLALACNEKSDADPQPMNPTASGGSAGTTADSQGGDSATPEDRKGERGSSCNSDNDCEDELSCVVNGDCAAGAPCNSKSCQPSNFALMGTGKLCHVSDCKAKADCCGDMPLQAPAACAGRDSICNRPTLPGCTAVRCTSSADCIKGTCGGKCSLSGAACLTTADCAVNTCDTSTEPDTCSVNGSDCSSLTCAVNTCSLPICNCANPEYAPTSPICSDPECEGICGFDCVDERCVVDTACTSDATCPATTPFCNEGVCAECRTTADCKEEECIAGHCGPTCEADTQCSLFEACQAGECVYVGCRSDRECVLQAGIAPASPTQDPRLAKCNVKDNLGTCVFPCEIDAQCAATEVCFEGTCKYIGCETDAECKTIAHLHDLPVPTPERPWTTTAVCRAESTAAP